MSTYTFKTNINCGSCIKSVTPFLNELDNVDSWKVDTENPDKILEVELDDENIKAVLGAVEKAGFKNLEFNQTLFGTLDSIKDIQLPKPGFGEGAFVVVRATKK